MLPREGTQVELDVSTPDFLFLQHIKLKSAVIADIFDYHNDLVTAVSNLSSRDRNMLDSFAGNRMRIAATVVPNPTSYIPELAAIDHLMGYNFEQTEGVDLRDMIFGER